MSSRRSSRLPSSSKSAAKIARVRQKSLAQKARIKQLNATLFKRHADRVQWWCRAFRKPLSTFGHFGSASLAMLWAGLLNLISFKPSTPRRHSATKSLLRAIVGESLEARHMMAADVEFQFTSSSSPEGATSGGPTLYVKGDLSGVANSLDRTVSFTFLNSSTSLGDFGSNGVSGITGTFVIPQVDYSAGQAFDLQAASVVTISNDQLVEGSESFAAQISGLGAQLKIGDANGGGLAISTTAHNILDNDTAEIQFSAGGSLAKEEVSPHNVVAVLALSTNGSGPAQLQNPVTTNVSAVSGSATGGGTDYNFPSTPMISFGAGAGNGATVAIPLTITNDAIVEGNETLEIKLDAPTGPATSNAATHTVTIDDDDVVTVSLVTTATGSEVSGKAKVDYSYVYSGTGSGSPSLATGFDANLTRADGTAIVASDVDGLGSPVKFSIPAGPLGLLPNTGSFDDLIFNDRLLEGNEDYTVKITSLSTTLNGQAVIGVNDTSKVTITDDEEATAEIELTVNLIESAVDAPPPVKLVINGTGSGLAAIAPGNSVTVDLIATPITAGISDYTLTSPSVTFPANSVDGQTTAIALADVNDGLLEGTETFKVDVSKVTALSGKAVVTPLTSSSTVTIFDDEAGTVGFDSGTTSGSETNASIAGKNVVLTISGTKTVGSFALGPGVSVSAPIVTGGGSATVTADYVLSTTSASFSGGAPDGATAPLTIAPVNDRTLEGTEDAVLLLQAATATGPAGTPLVFNGNSNTKIDITDDESAVIDLGSASVSETAAATNTAPVTLSISGTGLGPLQIGSGISLIAISNSSSGTANDPADYSFSGGSFNFGGGALSGDVVQSGTVTPVNDFIYEGTESFNTSIGSFFILAPNAGTINAKMGNTNSTVSIIDNEAAVISFTTASSAVTEASGSANVSVSLNITGSGTGSPTLGVPVSATVDTTGGTATKGVDYTGVSKLVTFNTGVPTPQNVALTIVSDPPEGSETAIFGLSGLSAGATIGSPATHTLTIHDRVVTIKAIDTNPVEDAVSNAQFRVNIDTPSANPTVVVFEIDASSTATLGGPFADYVFGPQVTGTGPYTVTIPANAASTTFDVDILDDTVFDPNETIKLNLLSGSALPDLVSLGTPSTDTMTIKDNETAPQLVITGKVDGAEGIPSATVNGKFTVTLGSGFDDPTQAVFTVGNTGSFATNSVDYNFAVPPGFTFSVSGSPVNRLTVNIPAGATSFDINVNVLSEGTIVEATETVQLSPLSLTGGSVNNATTTVNITDDDAAVVSVGPDQTVTESGASSNINFTLTNKIAPFAQLMTSSTDTVVTFSKVQDPDTTYGVDYVLYSNIDTPVAIGSANTFATPTNLNTQRWNIANNANITTPTTVPHLTVSGTSDGGIRYYSFTLLETSNVTLDFDSSSTGTPANQNPLLAIWNAATGAIVGQNDTSGSVDAGSTSTADPFLSLTNLARGTYVVGIAATGTTVGTSGFGASPTGIASGLAFNLHLSATSVQSAEPTTVVIPAGSSTGTALFNPVDEIQLESDEFVQYTLTSLAGDADITIDNETVNTPDDNVIRIKIDEVTTGNVQIQGTAPTFVDATNRLNGLEGGQNGRFLVTMDKPSDRPVVVPFRINPGSVAKVGDDFTFGSTVAGTGTATDPYRVTIAAGAPGTAATQIIDINVINETVVEIDEILTLDLLDAPTPANNAILGPQLIADGDNPDAQITLGTPNSDSILIKDEDLAVVSINSSTDLAFEGGSDGVFTIFLSRAVDTGKIDPILPTTLNPVTSGTNTVVTYQITGPAGNSLDIDTGKLPLTGTVTIPAGQTGTTLTVDALTDLLNEPVEDVVLKILTITTGDSNIIINPLVGGDQDTVFVVDNNSTTVKLIANDKLGAENPDNDGQFTVFLDGAAIPASTIVVTYSVTGTATSTIDFKALTGTATITSSLSTSTTITIDVLDDIIVDPNETVILTLTGVSGAPLGVDVKLDSNPANLTDTVTIADDDTGTVKIYANPLNNTAREGKDNGEYIVELSNPSATGVLVNYTVTTSLAPNNATAGSDYKTLSGSVFVAPNQTTASIPLEVLDDSVTESNTENVIVTLSSFGNPAYSADPIPANTTALIPILPDQVVKVKAISNATEGVSVGQFMVEIDSPSTSNVLISYTLGGTAIEGTDYASQTKTVIIPANATTALITIDPTITGNDTVLEGSETVIINLVSVTNVAPDPSADITISSVPAEKSATLTIADDDKAYVTIAATDGKEGGPNGSFTVTLRDVNGNPTTATVPISVNYNYMPGTALTPDDFSGPASPVVIAANSTSAIINITVVDDAFVEGTETVTVDVTGTADPRVLVGTIAGPTVSFRNGVGSYAGAEDIYIEQAAPSINGDGAGMYVNTNSLILPATTAQHSLLKFNSIFGPGAILPNSKIANAVLDVYVPFSPTDATGGDISLHKMLFNWNESLTWTASGAFGDFAPGLAANGVDASVAGVAFTLVEPGVAPPLINSIPVTADLQAWSNGQSNFGWGFLPIDTIDGTFFLDSEFINVAFRPQLTVTVSTSATLNILDNDSGKINITKTDNAKEDITNGLVTVAVDSPIPAANTLTIFYSVGSGGTATAGSDYTPVTGSFTISGGTSGLFQVPVLMDSLIEGNENVEVTLTGFNVTGPNAAALTSALSFGTKAANVTIEDNDTSLVNVAVLKSGDEGPALPLGTHSDPVFRVSLASSTSTTPTVVSIAISGSSDFVAGSDYAVPGVLQVTIPAGSLFTDFTLDLLDDELNESSETATLTLTGIVSSNAGITLGTISASDTIEDDDALVADVTASDNTATENPTSNTGKFKISLNYASDQPTVIPFKISGSAALPNTPFVPSISVSGADYSLTGTSVVLFTTGTVGTVTFPASATPQSVEIIVTAVQDYIAEPGPNETVILTLDPVATNPNGAVGGLLDADTVNIVDEDFTVRVAKTDSPAQEDGPPISGFNGQYTVSIANPLPAGFPVTVPFTIVNGALLGTATYGNDYTVTGPGLNVSSVTPTLVSGTVIIPAGATQAVITVDVEADSLTEGTENIVLNIGTPTDGKGLSKLSTVPAETTATESITDNDVSKVSISVIDDTDGILGGDLPGIGEPNNGGAFRFSVDKKVEYVDTVVEYTVQASSTAGAGDYALGGVAGKVTITANNFFADVPLTVIDDLQIEGDETVVVKVTKVTTTPTQTVSIDGTKDTATATITDNETGLKVGIVAIDADAKEPSNPGIFLLSFPAGVTSKTNTVVTYTTTGTANTGTIGNTDYTPLSGTATILAGDNTATIVVSVLDDSVVEADETVIVTLNATTSNPAVGAGGNDTVFIDSEDTSIVSIDSVVNGAEDSTPAKVTVKLTNIADKDITIPLNEVPGTATSGGVDFTLPASITILAGQTSATINIPVTSDTLVEGTENFTVGLKAPTGLYTPPDVTSDAGTKLINIVDNDTSVLTISSPTITEGDSGTKLLTFTVTSPNIVADKFSVTYSVSGGTASSPQDYSGGAGTLNFAGNIANETATFTVTIVGDEIVEADETIKIKLAPTVTSPTPAVISQVTSGAEGTGTITNDDTATFTVTAIDGKENNSGSPTPVTFEVSSDKEIDVNVVLTVNYSGGDAKGVSFKAPYTYLFGDDYDNQADTLTYLAGTKGKVTLSTVAVNNDLIVEGLQLPPGNGFETFNAVTTAAPAQPRSVVIGTPSVSGRILDDDKATVTVTSKENVGDDDASEPGAGKGDGTFTFKLDNPVQAPTVISYSYKIAGANGDPGNDLKAPLTGTITIPGSVASAIQSTTLKIEVADDILLEDDEILELTITGVSTDPDVNFANSANQTVNIQDDDTATISIVATDNVAQEPDTTPNAGTATYTVSLSKLSDTPTTISLAIETGTTASPSDYTGLPAFVTIPANTLATTFTITAKDDLIVEPDEFLVVKLVPGTIFGNADITINSGSSQDKITIKDDGDGLFLKITKDQDASEPGTSAKEEGQFIVSLVDALGNPAVVPVGSTSGGLGIKVIYSVSGGTATNTQDYNAPTGVLTIAENKSSGLLSIDVTDDSLVEALETLEVTVTGIEDAGGPISTLPSVGGEPISILTNKASLTITDNDTANYSISTLNVSEGAGAVSLTVSIDKPLDITSTVDVTFTDFGATAGVDYNATKQTVTFLPGVTSQTILVPITDDALLESTEVFFTTLSSTTNFGGRSVTFGTGAVGILDNDSALPLLQIQQVKVGSTAWTTNFTGVVDPSGPAGKKGYAIPTGVAQDDTLPWNNINRVYVQFTENLDLTTLTTSNIVLRGVAGGAQMINFAHPDFGFDPLTKILTLPLAGNIVNDRLQLEVKDAVKSAAGAALDGEWVDNLQAFNSGSGLAGGTFQFRFNVLPGDATHSTITDILASPQPVTDLFDLSAIFASNGATTTLATQFRDVNGSGLIDLFDLSATFAFNGKMLPGSLPGNLLPFGGLGGFGSGLVLENGTTVSVVEEPSAAPKSSAVAAPVSSSSSYAAQVDSVFNDEPASTSNSSGSSDASAVDSVFADPFEDITL